MFKDTSGSKNRLYRVRIELHFSWKAIVNDKKGFTLMELSDCVCTSVSHDILRGISFEDKIKY